MTFGYASTGKLATLEYWTIGYSAPGLLATTKIQYWTFGYYTTGLLATLSDTPLDNWLLLTSL